MRINQSKDKPLKKKNPYIKYELIGHAIKKRIEK